MKRLMIVSCCAVALLSACGQLSSPNIMTEPENVSSAFTEPENVSSAFTETTVNSFNAPFITVDETLGLYAGMSTNSALSLCGKPLYVAMGNGEQIVWVYIVRELLVGNATGERILVKTSDLTEFASTMHYLALSFEFGELSNWAQIFAGGAFNSLIFGASSD